MADPVPVHAGVGFADVLQVRAVGVTEVEQVAEDPYGVTLLPVAEQSRHGYVQVLPEEVEQRRLDGRDGVDGGPQVEGLGAASAGVPVGEPDPDLPQDALVVTHLGPDDQRPGVPQGQVIFSPPGTSPSPVRPSESVRTTTLRVK